MLTNLYVGLNRENRGEKLSALRLIQGHAVDRILELAEKLETATDVAQDRFVPDRRYEQRYPQIVAELPKFIQGYERNRASALAIMEFLERFFEINPAMRQSILSLCEG